MLKASFRRDEMSIYVLPSIGLNRWENASFRRLTQRQGKIIDADVDEF